MNRLSVLILFVAAIALAATPNNPTGRLQDGVVNPQLAALRAEAEAALAAGDAELAKDIEARIQGIYLAAQPDQEAQVLPADDLPRKPSEDTPDITVISSAGGFAAHATDYQMDGTMYVAASFRSDSACRIYKSTDHGQTWDYLCGFFFSTRSLMRKLQLVVGDGDSARIYVFCMHDANNGDLHCIRYNMDGTGLTGHGVLTGADTITDFAACRDFSTFNYWLYAVAHNGWRPGNSPPSHICRSTDFGLNWATVRSNYNFDRPHISAGAGSYIYLAGVPNQSNWKGWVSAGLSRDFGENWEWCSFKPDSGRVFDCAISPAFTKPESSATVWCAYSHQNLSSVNFEILSMYTTNAGDSWYGPATAHPGPDPGYVDLRNYYSLGNTYMNVTYNSYGAIYRQFANAPSPDAWSDTVRIDQTYPGALGINVGPQLCYSPGGGSGSGSVWMSEDSTKILWNSPWTTGIGSGRSKAVSARALGVAPNPASARLQFNWSGTARSLAVFDRSGRLVRRFEAPAGNSLAWDRTDCRGRSTSAGVYFVRLETGFGIDTRSFVLK